MSDTSHSFKIVVHNPLGMESLSLDAIRSAAPDAQVVQASAADLTQELLDARVFFGFCDPSVFAKTPQLEWIQTSSAGLDAILTPELIARDLLITNASGVHAPQLAEAAWSMTLSLIRSLPLYHRQQRDHTWEWGPIDCLTGSTAGIIGLGGTGRRFADIAAAFGMRVLAVDPHTPPRPACVESIWGLERLDEMIAASKVLLIACPFTSETHQLLDERRLALLPDDAVLINIARGDIIDQNALISTLQSGRILGAGLDVTEIEPLPQDSPLWDLPNLVLTPHCAGASPHRNRRVSGLFCENLRRFQAGEPLLNLVDQQRGYPIPTPDLEREPWDWMLQPANTPSTGSD